MYKNEKKGLEKTCFALTNPSSGLGAAGPFDPDPSGESPPLSLSLDGGGCAWRVVQGERQARRQQLSRLWTQPLPALRRVDSHPVRLPRAPLTAQQHRETRRAEERSERTRRGLSRTTVHVHAQRTTEQSATPSRAQHPRTARHRRTVHTPTCKSSDSQQSKHTGAAEHTSRTYDASLRPTITPRTAQHSTAQHSTAQHSTAQNTAQNTAQHTRVERESFFVIFGRELPDARAALLRRRTLVKRHVRYMWM